MARTLYLMRHAKSSWKEPLPDHERPLNKRGRRAAKAIGKALARQGICPDLILSSTALRAYDTAGRVAKRLDPPPQIISDDELYEADESGILSTLFVRGEEAEKVLLIGHNPTLSDLAVRLSKDERFQWLPTGAVVGLHWPNAKKWEEIVDQKGEITLELYPRALEE